VTANSPSPVPMRAGALASEGGGEVDCSMTHDDNAIEQSVGGLPHICQ